MKDADMQDFIIFFSEKEGTSPLVRLLDNFDQISILHQIDDSGWEPFDEHNCGPMSLRDLKRCLNIVFSKEPIDMEELNRIYTKTSTRPLDDVDEGSAVGFKMRFVSPNHPFQFNGLSMWNKLSRRLFDKYVFKNAMIDVLKRNNVVVFLAIRQDVLRWGLSKYHGDGTGDSGHLQFKLASGEINKDEIGRFHVDCEQLEAIISHCEAIHAQKRRLMRDLKSKGIQVYPVRYEDFLEDKHAYFKRFFDLLGADASKEAIDTALERGAYFKKVHSDDISDIVVNHQEVVEQFGDRFVAWN